MEENLAVPKPPAPPSLTPAVAMPSTSTVCASCGAVVPANYTFCPNCGKPLSGKSLSTTLFTKISLYAMSALLPPLGLWPGIKYFKSSDEKAQRMGMIMILITIASTIITLWATYAFLQTYLNALNSALNGTGITPSEATGGLF